jgi:hypothetical protein
MTGQAQAFQTTLSNTVTSVSIDAEFGATDTFLGIYNDNAGEPWTFVGLVVSGTLLPPGVHTFPTMISLLPSTTYWLILSGTSGGWVYNSGTTGSGAGYLSTNALNSSGSWTVVSSQPYRLEIQAVPEPSDLAIAAAPLAIGSLMIFRYRALRRTRRDSNARDA